MNRESLLVVDGGYNFGTLRLDRNPDQRAISTVVVEANRSRRNVVAVLTIDGYYGMFDGTPVRTVELIELKVLCHFASHRAKLRVTDC